MIPLALAVFTASLVGSLHCAGMCGPLVALAGADGAQERRGLPAPLAWNAGRLAAYVALGLAAGGVGAVVDVGGALAGVRHAALLVAGVGVVLAGVATLAVALGARVPRVPVPGVAGRGLARGMRAVSAAPATGRAFVLGVLTGCLPCGWLWAFVVTAAGTGRPLDGALVMATFWLGTVPLMLGLGAGGAALAAPLRRHLPAACAALMIAVGVVAVAARVRPLVAGPSGAPHGAGPTATVPAAAPVTRHAPR